MRSGWPHAEDGQPTPANQGQAPFGPQVSWPNGFSQLDHQGGNYRYPAPQLPAGNQSGAHPYASFNAAGYGDDGYTDPGYQGPSAQDAGIAGTRTVRGFVEGQNQAGYPQAGYPQNGYSQPRDSYGQSGYGGPEYPEVAYPPAAPESSHGSDLYQQPWDYDQPLRYEGEDDAYPVAGNYPSGDDYGRDGYGRQRGDGAERYQRQGYDPGAYNGSDYSMPGIGGPGYDLSGIIGTSDFEVVGYDEPSYGRLAYDDPRYSDSTGYGEPGQRFDETRFDVPRFDETRLDNLWLPNDDVRREAGSAGYGNDGFSTQRTTRSEPSPVVDSGRNARNAQTRYDLQALVEPGDATRFDVPVFDETRLDNMRPLTPARGMRASAATLLAPSGAKSRNWAEDTSLDHFADLDLTDEPVPAAFTRTAFAPPTDHPLELAPGQDDDTATRRAIGRRRGRSGDRRQWMALGAIAVVAAGAIGGVLMKYVFSGPSGPAHQVVVPASVDGYTQSPSLVKQTGVANEAKQVQSRSSGQASNVVYTVYQQGSLTSASSSSTQIFMFVGGKLANTDPSASIANFEQTYPGSTVVPAGSLGGEAACTETKNNDQSVSMCVWFDNDTFGTLVSPTMTTAKLAATLDAVRPSLELGAQ